MKYISLEGIVDFKGRTRFFESLMRAMISAEFVTVTEAYCCKPRTISIEDESADDDRKDLESSRMWRGGLCVGRGGSSFVIDELYGRGYYIVKYFGWSCCQFGDTDLSWQAFSNCTGLR